MKNRIIFLLVSLLIVGCSVDTIAMDSKNSEKVSSFARFAQFIPFKFIPKRLKQNPKPWWPKNWLEDHIYENKLSVGEWHKKQIRTECEELKEELEHTKRVYETYIEVLVEYHIAEVAYSAIMSQEHLDTSLKQLAETPGGLRKYIFGGEKPTEEEKLEKDVKYFQDLIKQIKSHIKMWDDETKTKIAKDSVEKHHSWLRFTTEIYSRKKKTRRNPTKRWKV